MLKRELPTVWFACLVALAAGLLLGALASGPGAQAQEKKKGPAKKADPGKPDDKSPARLPMAELTIAGAVVKLGVTPADAVLVAEADSQALGADAPFYRYVWVADSELDSMRAVSLAVNYPSHASVIVRPAPVAAGRVLLVRVDLRKYAPEPAQWEQFLKLWEDYANDPKFSLLLTKDTLKALNLPGDKVPVVKVKRKVTKALVGAAPAGPQEWREEVRVLDLPKGAYAYPDDSGRVVEIAEAGRYNVRLKFKAANPNAARDLEVQTVEETVEVKLTDVKDVDLVRLPGRHLPPQYEALSARLRTAAPIVSHDYWVCRHLSTIKDSGPWAELYGGRYYDFALFKRDQAKGTDEDHVFERLGLGDVNAGITAAKVFDRVKSDQRAAIFASDVADKKPRLMELLRSPTGRDGTGLVSVTHDLFKKSIDIGQHPLMNLVTFPDDGREGIAEQANGLHLFWITDGKGKLADEAPPDLVQDHEVPAPHDRRLQPAISCIRCHGKGRDDGWKPVTNSVKALLASKRIDVFGDRGERNKSVTDTLDRLAGQYAGEPERKLLPRARDDYAEAVLKATGPWPQSPDQANVVTLASAQLAKVWGDRNYKTVGARQALLELGLVCDEKDAVAVLDAVLPPAIEDAALGVVPEDIRIGALLTDKPRQAITRVDWDLVYGFAAPRAQRAVLELQKGKK